MTQEKLFKFDNLMCNLDPFVIFQRQNPNYTNNCKINGTPKGAYLPFSKLHSI